MLRKGSNAWPKPKYGFKLISDRKWPPMICRQPRRVTVIESVISTQSARGHINKFCNLAKIQSIYSHLSRWATSRVATSGSILSLQPSSDPPSLWLVAATMVGLPLALWIYKCLMMVIFQRKIIYMGYAPPGARTEELHASLLPRGIRCTEVCLESEKHVRLHGITIHQDALDASTRDPDVVIVYLQGNAGNPLARIPVFEKLLSGLSQSQQSPKNSTLSVHIIAVAPRSYWKSSSRTPTERSLIADYHRVLSYAAERYPKSTIVLYGHSLGGAIAVCLASHLSSTDYPTVQGLVLENPFASIPDMVQALYPQRWLPYRYLGYLAFDKWNAVAAMQSAKGGTDSLLSRLSRDMLVLLSEKDEIVPPTMGEEIYRAGESTRHQGTNYRSAERGQRRLVMVRGALHEQAWMHRQWVNEMTAYVHQVRARKDCR